MGTGDRITTWTDGTFNYRQVNGGKIERSYVPVTFDEDAVKAVGGTPNKAAPLDTITIALPPEVAQYKEDLRRFVDAMVFKLAAKAHKGRWEEMPIAKAMELLRGEEAELTEAIERGNLVEVLLEAADVGNFALIVSAIAIERGK